MPTRAVRVAVVYGNRLFGECLGEALSTDPDVEVVLCLPANPSTWMKVVQSAESVVLLQSSTTDAQSPTNGNRVPLNLQNRILVVGDDDEEDSVRRAVDTGATAYLPCSVSFKTATEAVKALANGGAVTSPKVVAFLFTQLARVQTKRNHSIPQQRLTRRERQVIQLVGAGLTNKEIATRLGIEVQTVKNHVHNILDKLEKKGRHAAARYAFETGLAAPMPRPLTEQTRSQA